MTKTISPDPQGNVVSTIDFSRLSANNASIVE
jgi:hypothetical protein